MSLNDIGSRSPMPSAEECIALVTERITAAPLEVAAAFLGAPCPQSRS
jgi:hypothetical protein